jgi:hypothetical protein
VEPVGTTAERLYRGFMAPLVLGGEMNPGKPIGARAAIKLGEERVDVDAELASEIGLARVRVARLLAPVDRFEHATRAEWMIAAALHDLVQATHPGFDAAFRRSGPARIVELVEATLEAVEPPSSLRDVLSRHTWLSRVFEITRTDTTVSWWTGSSRFLGTDPPPRLAAWPELRRVHVDKTPRSLVELPATGASAAREPFARALGRILEATPLTDLATCTRADPAFAWTPAALSLVATSGGRTLAIRAMGRERDAEVDAALGRATKPLLDPKARVALLAALPLLAERAIAIAQASGNAIAPVAGDAAFARGCGAIAARALVASGAMPLAPRDAVHVTTLLDPIAQSMPREMAGAVSAAIA